EDEQSEEDEEEEEVADEDANEETGDDECDTADDDAVDVDNSEEADDPEFEVKFISRSTSPLRAHDTDTNCNKESQLCGSSDNQTASTDIASIEQIVRPKKNIFGNDAAKCHQATQVNEADLSPPNRSRSS